MKGSLILSALLYLCISGTAQNQLQTSTASESNASKWKIVQISGKMSSGIDRFSNLNKEWIVDHADFSSETEEWQSSLIPEDQNGTMHSNSANYGLYFTLGKDQGSGLEKSIQSNLQFGVKFRNSKSTGIQRSSSFDYGEYTSVSTESHRISDKEIDLSAAYLLSKDWSWCSIYTGALVEVGTNFNGEYQIHSTTFNYSGISDGELQIEGTPISFIESEDIKQRLFSRVFIPIGFQFKPLDHLSADIGYQFGAGLDKVFGGKTHIIQQTSVFELGLTYHI